ncbi:MAG: internalization-related competence protein ComEC/Rec2 protein [Candidatus Moranbacteria bacterium GW2011_GWE1_35_17]|nr:MAG: internalization-related competence protein ComEC/Rec2 protein [Candidatus Moranbacteria bacterium GW2011_GWE1_35_17]
MTKSRIFFFLLLSFIGGVFYQSFWPASLILIWLVLISAVILCLANYKSNLALVLSLMGIFFLLGIARTEIDLLKIKKIKDNPGNIALDARIIREPEKKEYYQNLVITVAEDELFENGFQNKLKILVRTELYREFNYGDIVRLRCQPEIVKNFSPDFNYKMYLAKDKIYYTCAKAEIEKIEESKRNLYTIILSGRKKMENNIAKIIPQPEAALAQGILFGGSNRLSKELQGLFSKTGMSHIIAVSGYNVTIIAQYLMIFGIFLGLWRAQSFYFAILGIFIFIAMIGFPSSALRAGVMGGLILWAIKNGRLANLDNAILLAGAIMLIINPLILRWDIGFQLSFLATIGLVKLSPFWDKYFLKKYKSGGIFEIILMTISAQLFVLPIILYNFHNLAIISILANVLILPVIPVTMLFAFLATILSFIFYPLALVFGWLAYALLKYEIGTIVFLAKLKFSSLNVDDFNYWGVIIWYVALFGLVYFINKKIIGNNLDE